MRIARSSGHKVMDIVDLPHSIPGGGEQLFDLSSSGEISLIPAPTVGVERGSALSILVRLALAVGAVRVGRSPCPDDSHDLLGGR